VDININLQVKDGTLKIEAEPLKIEKQEVEVVIKTDAEQLAIERSKINAEQLQIKRDVEEMIEKAVEGIEVEGKRNEQILDMITVMGREVEESVNRRERLTEQERVDMELKKKKMEFLQKWIEENKDEEVDEQ